MSYKRGYTYDNVKEFCEKYDCKLLDSREEIDDKPVEFNIKAVCGHDSTTTFTKLFKYKIGIYCDDCFNGMDEAKCFSCGNMFEHSEKSFVYCSVQCSHSRKATDEHKQNTRDTHYKRLGYYDSHGKLMEKEDVKKVNLKKNEVKRRNAGMKVKLKYTYEQITKEYAKEGCELLTTEEDFNKNKSCRVFKINGKCGHVIEQSKFKDFLYMKTNINCKICTNKNSSIVMKNKSKINGISKTAIIENNGVALIRENCKNKFTIIKTRECCEADILVRPINENFDVWLPIQLKVTSKKHIRSGMSNYSFNIGKKCYNNMLLLLVCIEESKFWLFESNCESIQSLSKITIGNNKSII
jgi:hypothetical protein